MANLIIREKTLLGKECQFPKFKTLYIIRWRSKVTMTRSYLDLGVNLSPVYPSSNYYKNRFAVSKFRYKWKSYTDIGSNTVHSIKCIPLSIIQAGKVFIGYRCFIVAILSSSAFNMICSWICACNCSLWWNFLKNS